MNHKYSWYKTSGVLPGLNLVPSFGTCETSGRCDTEKYTEDVNKTGLCGYNDWIMPNFIELQSIVDYGTRPAIDQTYFANTPTNTYWWTSDVNANTGIDAWAINSTTG